MNKKDIFNKYKQAKERLESLKTQQFKLELHVENHPIDYQSKIANELLKSDIYRQEYLISQLVRRLE